VSCIGPGDLTLEFNRGSKKLIARWTFPAGIANRFYLELIEFPGVPVKREVVEKRNIFASARKFTFRHTHFRSGETFSATIRARCKDCELSEADETIPLTIP
jgi:hypothetical protein